MRGRKVRKWTFDRTKRYVRSPRYVSGLNRFVKSPLESFWRSLPSYLPFYVLFVVVAYAAYNGWKYETVISSFQLPPVDKDKALPFSGETVADMLQDAVRGIQEEAQGRPLKPPVTMLFRSIRNLVRYISG